MIVAAIVVLAAGLWLVEKWPARWPQMGRWILIIVLGVGVVGVVAVEWWYWLFY